MMEGGKAPLSFEQEWQGIVRGLTREEEERRRQGGEDCAAGAGSTTRGAQAAAAAGAGDGEWDPRSLVGPTARVVVRLLQPDPDHRMGSAAAAAAIQLIQGQYLDVRVSMCVFVLLVGDRWGAFLAPFVLLWCYDV